MSGPFCARADLWSIQSVPPASTRSFVVAVARRLQWQFTPVQEEFFNSINPKADIGSPARTWRVSSSSLFSTRIAPIPHLRRSGKATGSPRVRSLQSATQCRRPSQRPASLKLPRSPASPGWNDGCCAQCLSHWLGPIGCARVNSKFASGVYC
jgi:hypothetical protein